MRTRLQFRCSDKLADEHEVNIKRTKIGIRWLRSSGEKRNAKWGMLEGGGILGEGRRYRWIQGKDHARLTMSSDAAIEEAG